MRSMTNTPRSLTAMEWIKVAAILLPLSVAALYVVAVLFGLAAFIVTWPFR